MDSAGVFGSGGKECGYGLICLPTYPVQGICPNGWHLPTKGEFETLISKVGTSSTAGRMLKSSSEWQSGTKGEYYGGGNGKDEYGFTAYPTGYRYVNGVIYAEDEKRITYFWTSTEEGKGLEAFYMSLSDGNDYASLNTGRKTYWYSVRCVKDSDE